MTSRATRGFWKHYKELPEPVQHLRALAHRITGGVEWVWIGTHEEYNKLVR
jgi:hypothetical protein